MADYSEHRLLNYLDRPKYFLYWTLDEVGCVMGGLITGLFCDGLFKGLLGGLLLSYGVSRLKKRIGTRRLRHFLYWIFPHPNKTLKYTPPSCHREIL